MQKVKKVIGALLEKGVLAWMAAIVVWAVIVSTMRLGISCDEGFYLMGYLRNQSIGGESSEFHAIVRALCRPFPDDDVMVFRYLRLVLNLLALVVFAMTSFQWLKKKKGFSRSCWAYYPFVALAGAMSFTFAAPTISYDSIEQIITLLVASLLFVQLVSEKQVTHCLCAFGIGFLLWFAFINYPPAGICLILLFLLFYWVENGGNKWKGFVFGLLGVVVALVVQHCFIHDLKDWGANMSGVLFATFTQKSQSHHDAGSLVSGMLKVIGELLLILVPVVVVFTLLFKKTNVPKGLRWGIVLAVCAALLVVRQVYQLYGILILIPVALMMALVLSQPETKIREALFTKDVLLALILVAIPLAGVFGTNQNLIVKAMVFTPFWMLAYFLLSTKIDARQSVGMNLLYMTILFAGYVYLGNFSRYHYYYTPRSSKYELVGAGRPQRVLVSQYQQEYFQELFEVLQSAGCSAGDSYMAFGENQIAVYLAGGYIDGNLPYHWWQYKTFDVAAPKAFVLFSNEEAEVIEYFKQADWDFPTAYRRTEMRQMSENMGEELRTVVYVREENLKNDEQ